MLIYMPIYRYKLEINVKDNTSFSTFIVFGVEAEKIMNPAASVLVDRISNRVRLTLIYFSRSKYVYKSTQVYNIQKIKYESDI